MSGYFNSIDHTIQPMAGNSNSAKRARCDFFDFDELVFVNTREIEIRNLQPFSGAVLKILVLILDWTKGFHDNGFNMWSGFKAAIVAAKKK